jgi:hypothetical protein
MGDHDDLLARFKPQLAYDSIEQYFADSAAQWTENPGNQLRRADTTTGAGALLAQAGDGLALDFLGAEAYASGDAVVAGDRIGDPHTDYRTQYVALRTARPELSNRIHGRAVEADGRVWLQYWFWYFYNDYNLALGAGRHEGDWEMVQLRLYGDEPDLAVYAQHRRAEKRPWSEVRRAPDRPDTPMVYVARGSHASYFEPGFHQTEAWYDLADGKRETPELALEVLDESGGWAVWPGIWGDTRPRIGGGLGQPSPKAPCAHGQWADPDSLLASAWEPVRSEAIAAPDVTVARDDGLLRVDFDFSNQEGPAPASLSVTVNSRDEPGVPPATTTFVVTDLERGSLRTRLPVDAAKHYDVYVSTTGGDPPVPSASALTELDPVGLQSVRSGFGETAVRGIGKLIARLRGHLPWLSRSSSA